MSAHLSVLGDEAAHFQPTAGVLACRGELTLARQMLCRQILRSHSGVECASAMSNLAAISAADGFLEAARKGWNRAHWETPDLPAIDRNVSTLSSLGPGDRSVNDESPPTRIAILSLLFNWPSTGGGTVHTKELADALSAVGYDVRHIYAVYEPWGVGGVTEDLSVPSVPIEFRKGDWNAASIQDRFRRAVDQFAPDVVIITDSWNSKPLLAETVADYPYFLRLAALETICPLNNVRLYFEDGCLVQCLRNQLVDASTCVACVNRNAHHSGRLHEAERRLVGFSGEEYEITLLGAYRRAEGVLVVNPEIAEMVRPFCRRIDVVPSGFDEARFQDLPDGAKASEITRFIFAGLAVEPMKGFSVLIAACQQLWASRQDFELVVTSEPLPGVEAPFIRWIGWQTQTDLPPVIAQCDVLVFPTIAQEALGRTAVEAMGCARPVIASRLGGLPWVVEDGVTGLTVSPGDPSDLADKMSTLIGQPSLRDQFGQAGREKFLRDFTWPVIVDRYYHPLFQRVVQRYRM